MAERKKKKPQKTKAKMGAPTKYTPAYCELLVVHMMQGFSFDSFPATIYEETKGVIRVTKPTLYAWEKKYPDFLNAKSIGTSLSFKKWEKIAQDALVAGTPFNAAVWIFNMKNRFGWRDKMEHTSPDGSMTAPQVILFLPENGRSGK